MPKFAKGNMWDVWDDADLFLITTNSFIKKNKELTMGRGIAQQAAMRDPQIPLYFGRELTRREMHLKTYGLLIPPLWPHRKESAFQTKIHWRDKAKINVIGHSIELLTAWATDEYTNHPEMKIHLNFPGIGYGGLARDILLSMINKLPDNITIWEYANE